MTLTLFMFHLCLGSRACQTWRRKFNRWTPTSFWIWMRATRKPPSRRPSTREKELLTTTDSNRSWSQPLSTSTRVPLDASSREVLVSHRQDSPAMRLTSSTERRRLSLSILNTSNRFNNSFNSQLEGRMVGKSWCPTGRTAPLCV